MDDRRCGACRHFLPPNACEIVQGEIAPDMWCKFFAPRTVRQDIQRAMG